MCKGRNRESCNKIRASSANQLKYAEVNATENNEQQRPTNNPTHVPNYFRPLGSLLVSATFLIVIELVELSRCKFAFGDLVLRNFYPIGMFGERDAETKPYDHQNGYRSYPAGLPRNVLKGGLRREEHTKDSFYRTQRRLRLRCFRRYHWGRRHKPFLHHNLRGGSKISPIATEVNGRNFGREKVSGLESPVLRRAGLLYIAAWAGAEAVPRLRVRRVCRRASRLSALRFVLPPANCAK